jgi:hypothetical protein
MIDAHEVWAMAQLLPNEGIEDGVARIETYLAGATTERERVLARAVVDNLSHSYFPSDQRACQLAREILEETT